MCGVLVFRLYPAASDASFIKTMLLQRALRSRRPNEQYLDDTWWLHVGLKEHAVYSIPAKIASFNYFESGNRESDDESDDEPLELWVSYVKPNPAESNGVLIPPASLSKAQGVETRKNNDRTDTNKSFWVVDQISTLSRVLHDREMDCLQGQNKSKDINMIQHGCHMMP